MVPRLPRRRFFAPSLLLEEVFGQMNSRRYPEASSALLPGVPLVPHVKMPKPCPRLRRKPFFIFPVSLVKRVKADELQEIPGSELCSTSGCSFGPPCENAKTLRGIAPRVFFVSRSLMKASFQRFRKTKNPLLSERVLAL